MRDPGPARLDRVGDLADLDHLVISA